MSTKLIVKIQNSDFPVRINGARYQNGDELEINESQLTPKIMEVIETIEGNSVGDDPFKELENKSVEELQAYAVEHGIEIGNATSVNGIIKKIKEAAEKTE